MFRQRPRSFGRMTPSAPRTMEQKAYETLHQRGRWNRYLERRICRSICAPGGFPRGEARRLSLLARRDVQLNADGDGTKQSKCRFHIASDARNKWFFLTKHYGPVITATVQRLWQYGKGVT